MIKKMNYEEQDLLVRLHQSYLLQLNMIKQTPWILDFFTLELPTSSSKINQKLHEQKEQQTSRFCYDKMFTTFDKTKFKQTIDVSSATEIIFWGLIGFSQALIKEIKESNPTKVDYHLFDMKLTRYFDQLRAVFYEK